MVRNGWKDIISGMVFVLLILFNVIVLQVASAENQQFYCLFLISVPFLIKVLWCRIKK